MRSPIVEQILVNVGEVDSLTAGADDEHGMTEREVDRG
jgi:hypothetical protein